MAIERINFGGSAQTSEEEENLNRLKEILEHLAYLQTESALNDKQIQDECNRVVRELVIVNVPRSANNIKEFQQYLNSVGQSLERIIRQSSNPEQIFIGCLQTLYCLLVSNDSPSAGSGIIFDIYDQDSIPKAIKLLIKNTANMGVYNDNDFKKVAQTLCTWLRTFSGLKNLSYCIIYFLDGLRDLHKYALLMEIADSVIERLCLSLIIPVVRPNCVKVLSHILCSAQSKALFMKIVPRIPKIIQTIQGNLNSSNDNSIPPEVQLFIDLISAFVNRYGVYDLAFSEITNTLNECKIKVSDNYESLLDVKPWHPPISIRDPKQPIGLVNLGNTCYMNSVLQALFMTKELTHDILLMKLPSKIINYIQQLISLLLYSERQELTPHDVLGQRPTSFRYGHQQDSFEYLGYLLDQLHEEEKRCLTAAAKTIDNANGKLTNGNINKMKNGNGNAEQMDIDDNNLSDTIGLDSPPLSDESDDAINPDESKAVTNTVRTLVQKLFGGRLSINYKCLNCFTESTNIDNFFDLQLSFPQQHQQNQCGDSLTMSPLIDKTNYTTQSLLNSYFATEHLINDDKYFCDKCKALCDGERHITLEEAPSNLILVIKHFKYDRNYHVRRKLLHKVHHDDVISLLVRTKDGCYRIKYKLYAVIVHCGLNIDSGHYYTFAVNASDEWFKFNDSHISRSSFSDVKNLSSLNTPYILFYEFLNKVKVSESDILNQTDIETATHLGTNEICRKRKAEQPRWDDLPPKLQEFVKRDNHTYADQFRSKHLNGNEMIKNYYNKHRKSDNDPQDPPSSCGGNIVEQSNGYIY